MNLRGGGRNALLKPPKKTMHTHINTYKYTYICYQANTEYREMAGNIAWVTSLSHCSLFCHRDVATLSFFHQIYETFRYTYYYILSAHFKPIG